MNSAFRRSDNSRPYTPTYPRTKRDSFNYESDDGSAQNLKEDFSVQPTQRFPSPVYLSRPKTPQLQQTQSPVTVQQQQSVVAPQTLHFPTDTIQTQSRQSSYIVSRNEKALETKRIMFIQINASPLVVISKRMMALCVCVCYTINQSCLWC